MNLIYQKAIEEKLDMEWASLIILSRKMGISIEEIREFLKLCPIKENGGNKA
ncbi:DNA-binding anti-repressor SinI [Paenibacillus sp. LMG 31456]|uniref:DNA-binding anti-repressor SinI n=1 Tax=Paenibacillus foliorum TaxID=2654974 RepID=A0A972GVA8_9BACL|nr:anti-repressor SinI family protein [Paenibacillus foliorum]NOU97317.1 DNA-binding anti-repressor SinI [Paenibacillus foliorum]